jgi:hypothetical protein
MKEKCVKKVYVSEERAAIDAEDLREEYPDHDWEVLWCSECNGWHIWRDV